MRVSSFPSFVRGDTVTMEFKTGLDLAHVSSAVLVIEQCGYTITKEGDALEVSGGSVRGTLTPSESMTLIPGRVSVQLSLRFEDGTVFSSDPETWMVENRVGGSTGSSTVLADAEFSAYVGIPVPAPHPDLEGRDLPDQHPITAVTGLEDALASKADGVATAQALASKADADATERALADRVGRDEFSRAMDGKADTAALTGEAMLRTEGDTALRMLISDEVRDRRDAVASEASARDAAVASLSTRIDRKQDQLTAGQNVTIRDGVISAAGTEYGQATNTAPGLMSASDKAKLDTVARGAEPNVIESVRVNGSPLTVTADGAVNVDLSGYATKADLSTIPKWDKVVVDRLPTTGIQLDKIYLVPNSGSGTNSRDEYIYVDGKWELIGTTETDISGKQDVITGAASTVTSADLTAGRVLVSDSAGKIAVDSLVTVSELRFLDGVKSNLQTQMDAEAVARADADADIRRAVDAEVSARDAAVKAEASARANAVNALNSSAVKLTGDQTVNGIKTFAAPPTIQRTDAWVSLNFKSMTYDATDDSITTDCRPLDISAYDKNQKKIGAITNFLKSHESLTRIGAFSYDTEGNTVSYGYLELKAQKNGSVFATAPTPLSTSDNSTKIATTAWVNSASTVVHTTSVEVISGQKTFKSGIIVNNQLEVFGATPFIDFHFDNNTMDYTTRFINDVDGIFRLSTKTLDDTKRFNLTLDANTQTASLSTSTRSTGYKTTDIVTTGWADAKYVNLSGDQTITGLNKFTKSPTIETNWPAILVKNSDLEIDVVPSAWRRMGGVGVQDRNGTEMAWFDTTFHSNGAMMTSISVQNKDAEGNRVSGAINVSVRRDGTIYATAPTPSSASNNSTQIATTAWVNSASSVVHTTGNDIIGGVKQFTQGILSLYLGHNAGEIPTSTQYINFVSAKGDDNQTFGFVRIFGRANTKERKMQLQVSRINDNGTTSDGAYIELIAPMDATPARATAPATRTTGYASNDIATAGWVDSKISSQKAETWTFTLDDGSTVTKEVLVR